MAEFGFGLIPDVRKFPTKPGLILSGFGLNVLKGAFFGFGENESDVPLDRKTYLGTPIFDNVSFEGGEYVNLEGETIKYLDDYIDGEEWPIDTVLVAVKQRKVVVKTPIQGRNGTVKEYIANDDYQITIRGAISDPSPSRYPEEEVQRLHQLCEVQRDIPITSRFLNEVFGITNIVITGYSFPQVEGMYNTQLFQIEAISDEPFEITR